MMVVPPGMVDMARRPYKTPILRIPSQLLPYSAPPQAPEAVDGYGTPEAPVGNDLPKTLPEILMSLEKGITYRGGSEYGDVGSQGGIFTTPDQEAAKTFGKRVHQYEYDVPDERILDLRKESLGGRERMTQLLSEIGIDPYMDFYGSLPNNFSDPNKKKTFVDFVRKAHQKTHDMVKMDDTDYSGRKKINSLVFFDKDKLNKK